jgi:hypothetical protein
VIVDASSRGIPSGDSLPQMGEVLLEWFQPMSFTTIVKSVVNFNLVEVETAVTTMGVRQPAGAQVVAMYPRGQRTWKYETIHSLPFTPTLSPDDVIVFNGTRYRVLGKVDYTEYGYIEHHITQDFQ